MSALLEQAYERHDGEKPHTHTHTHTHTIQDKYVKGKVK